MGFQHSSCEEVWAPHSLSTTTAVLSAILCSITVPGNLLICIAMVKDPHRQLRSSFNYFVLNLAIADLIIGTITEPTFIVFHVREYMHFPIAKTIWAVHLAYYISCTASLLSLSALTIDRYLTVTSVYKRCITPKRVFLVSIMIWGISLSVPCLYFVTGFYVFAFIFANTAIVASLVIISFAYSRVYCRLRAQVLRWGSYQQRQMRSKAIVFERKLTKSFLVILVFFILCLLPSCAMNYVINFCHSCSCTTIHWMRDLQFMFTLINCAGNQFLYALRMPEFRNAFITLLRLRSVKLFRILLERKGRSTALRGLNQREMVIPGNGNNNTRTRRKPKRKQRGILAREEVLLQEMESESL